MRRKRAFTLIELLVVVSIIALLASILMPSLSAARRSAKKAKCKANLHQLGIAMEAYLNRHKDYFPIACRLLAREMKSQNVTQYPAPDLSPGFNHPISVVLKNEISGNTELFECPEDFVDPEDALDYKRQDLNIHGKYFTSQKTSYEWNDILSDVDHPRRRRHQWIHFYDTGSSSNRQILLFKLRLSDVQLLNDFAEFHSGGSGIHNSWNELRADMSIRSVTS